MLLLKMPHWIIFNKNTIQNLYNLFSILSGRKKFSANTLLDGRYCDSESLAGAN